MKSSSFLISIAVNFLLAVGCQSRSIGLNEKEIECYSEKKVYHPEKDQCFRLLTVGPCDPGYWFVLKKPKKGHHQELKISPSCVEEKCADGSFYWPKTKSCVPPSDKNLLCGNSTDEEFFTNFFGEAECRCARDPPRARLNGDENNRCYQLYTRGPCPEGEILGFVSPDIKKATCVQDKCYKETVKRRSEGKLSEYGVLVPWTNGTCYELDTQGPCADKSTFKVLQTTLEPGCVEFYNAIFNLEKPQNCYQDENGDCQKKVNKSADADKYKEELLSALSSARKKRTIK